MAAMISSRRAETGKPSGNSIFSGLATRESWTGGVSAVVRSCSEFGGEFGGEFGPEFGCKFGFRGLDKTGDDLGDNPRLSQPKPAGTLLTPSNHVRCF
jgi:hypothetical protein